MNKKVFFLSFLLLLLIGNINSCKKKECSSSEIIEEPSLFDYLTEDSWKIEKFEEYIDGNRTRLNPGDPDERFVFSRSKDYLYFGYDGGLQDYGRFEFHSTNAPYIDLYLSYNRYYHLDIIKLEAKTFQYETVFENNGHNYRWVYYLYRP